MPHWMHLSNACAPCRLDWRPSRWLVAAWLILGTAGSASVLASEMPRLAGVPLAILALAHGLRGARRESMRPIRVLAWPPNESPRLDGVALDDVRLEWRGPLAFLRWRDADGRIQRLAWWPDTLPTEHRRALKLAGAGARGGRLSASMAP